MREKIVDTFGWKAVKYFILVSSILLFFRCHDEEKPWWWVPETVAEYPCWTPDGSKIAYCRHQQIWITDTLGNTWNMFEDTSFGATLPDFSYDGKWMVFVSGSQIYKARVTSDWKVYDSSIVKLTDIGRNFYPRWSPNGDLIVYDSNTKDDSITTFYGISLMSSSGTGKRRIEATEGDERQPDWSPNGKRIVYYGYFEESDAPEIVIISSDSSNLKRLTTDSIWDQDPTWSPDGYRIAFTRLIEEKEGGKSYIYLIDTTGNNLSRLTTGGEPTWSPNGQKLAFGDLEPKGEYGTLFVIDLQSKKRKQLVFKEE